MTKWKEKLKKWRKSLKEKPYNNWTMTAAQFRSYIVSALRKASQWWKPKSVAIARSRVDRGKYKCESCWKIWPATLPPLPGRKRKRKNIQADHIIPVVGEEWFTTYDDWIKRCFVEADGYQAICRECHSWDNSKTKKENEERRKILAITKEYWWKIFNKLQIIKCIWNNLVECECDCWNNVVANLANIKNWHTKSCWCIRWTHKMSNSRIYKIWMNMNSRCNNNKSTWYKYYWWRWIRVEWKSFEEFYEDMKEWYDDNLSIDRIDPNWNYCKDNCRWATAKEQANNKTSVNHKITFEWETKTISEWSDLIWIKQNTILYRIRRWWTVWEALWVDKRIIESKSKLKPEYYEDIIKLLSEWKTQKEIWEIYWIYWGGVVSRYLKKMKEQKKN